MPNTQRVIFSGSSSLLLKGPIRLLGWLPVVSHLKMENVEDVFSMLFIDSIINHNRIKLQNALFQDFLPKEIRTQGRLKGETKEDLVARLFYAVSLVKLNVPFTFNSIHNTIFLKMSKVNEHKMK